jgi:hypothetical protein
MGEWQRPAATLEESVWLVLALGCEDPDIATFHGRACNLAAGHDKTSQVNKPRGTMADVDYRSGGAEIRPVVSAATKLMPALLLGVGQ